MNAHSPTSDTPTPPAFSPVVLTYTDALRVLAERDTPMTATELAQVTGRVASNVKRDLTRLYDAGVLEWARPQGVTITKRGRAWLLGQDVAESGALPSTATIDPDAVALTCDQLVPDANNPRRRSGFSPAEIHDMAVSLKAEYDATGKPFITPPTVYPLAPGETGHRIAKGERRWHGWFKAVRQGWIPEDLAVTCPVYRGDATQALASAIVENLQRADLDNLEEAEAFAALADRLDPEAHPNPVAEICRQIGKSGESGERYVQERLRVARTATPEAKARFIESRRRAAEGEPDPDPFLWKHLRDSVKVPRHITALEKSPALRLLVLEMAALAGQTWDADVAAAPADDGLINQASAVGLVDYWPHQAVASLTGTACTWLDDLGWADRGAAEMILLEARTALIGEIGVAALAPGEQVSAELNPPQPAGEGNQPEAGGGAAPAARAKAGLDDDEDTDIPAFLRRLAGPGAAADPACVYNGHTYPNPTLAAEARRRAQGEGGASSPATTPKPSAKEDARQPTDREHLILVEVAWRADIARGGDGFADAFGIHGDPVAMAMIPHWLLTRMGDGCTRVALTRHAQAWLAGYYDGGLTPKDLDACRYSVGKIDFNTVEQLRASGRFATPWLNVGGLMPRDTDAARYTSGKIDTNTPDQADAPQEGSPSEAPAGGEGGTPNLDPVALMRRALTDLWLASGAHYAAAQAVLAATLNDDQAAREDADLAATAPTLQRALATAATFVPAEVKARLEQADQ